MRKNFVRKYTSPDKSKVIPFLAISENKKNDNNKTKKNPPKTPKKNKTKTYNQRDVSFLIHFYLLALLIYNS